MININRIKGIFLEKSELFTTLCEKFDPNQELDINPIYFIDENGKDIVKILETIRYWGLYFIPFNFLDVIRKTGNNAIIFLHNKKN